MQAKPEALEVVVDAHGPVTDGEREYARRKIGSLRDVAPGPVLFTKVDLVVHEDPARARPSFAKAEIDLNGQVVRAHAVGTTTLEAVDRLEDRLRERIERAAHRQEAKHLRHRGEEAWRHGDPPAVRRSDVFPRPPEEREIVRRKSFAVRPLRFDEAVDELEQLDHDFYLFTDADTGEDAVVHRASDDRHELVDRPSPLTVDDAIELLNLGDEPFVFFLAPETGRGCVVYRRYDGHYGLLMPADASS